MRYIIIFGLFYLHIEEFYILYTHETERNVKHFFFLNANGTDVRDKRRFFFKVMLENYLKVHKKLYISYTVLQKIVF